MTLTAAASNVSLYRVQIVGPPHGCCLPRLESLCGDLRPPARAPHSPWPPCSDPPPPNLHLSAVDQNYLNAPDPAAGDVFPLTGATLGCIAGSSGASTANSLGLGRWNGKDFKCAGGAEGRRGRLQTRPLLVEMVCLHSLPRPEPGACVDSCATTGRWRGRGLMQRVPSSPTTRPHTHPPLTPGHALPCRSWDASSQSGRVWNIVDNDVPVGSSVVNQGTWAQGLNVQDQFPGTISIGQAWSDRSRQAWVLNYDPNQSGAGILNGLIANTRDELRQASGVAGSRGSGFLAGPGMCKGWQRLRCRDPCHARRSTIRGLCACML